MLPQWSDQIATVHGVQIHYLRSGHGDKPAVVLAHGFSDNGLCWLPLARDLQADYDVILPDARGHGQSQRVQPGEFVDNPADLAGLIAVLKLDRPIVGGHSMGASTAAACAARFPEQVRALILEDPGWRDQPPPSPAAVPARPAAMPDWLARYQHKTQAEIIAMGKAESPTWPDVEWIPWAISKQELDPQIGLVENARMSWREAVAGIRCPTLLLTADTERGSIVSAEQATEAVEISGGKIHAVHIPGVGHCIRRENYPLFLQAVRAFLAQVADGLA